MFQKESHPAFEKNCNNLSIISQNTLLISIHFPICIWKCKLNIWFNLWYFDRIIHLTLPPNIVKQIIDSVHSSHSLFLYQELSLSLDILTFCHFPVKMENKMKFVLALAVKSLETPFPLVVFFFLFTKLYISTEDNLNYERTVLNNPEYVLYLFILQSSHLMPWWHLCPLLPFSLSAS